MNQNAFANIEAGRILPNQSQHFIKLEALPVPNDATIAKIEKKCLYGAIFYMCMAISNIVMISVCPVDTNTGYLNWIIIYLTFILLQLLTFSTMVSTKKKFVAELEITQRKMIQSAKLWGYKFMSYIFDMVMDYMAYYGIFCAIFGSLSGNKIYRNYVIVVSVIQIMYYSISRSRQDDN